MQKKRNYEEPTTKEYIIEGKLLSEVSAESSEEGVKPGEGGEDLSRVSTYNVWEDEDNEEEEEDY